MADQEDQVPELEETPGGQADAAAVEQTPEPAPAETEQSGEEENLFEGVQIPKELEGFAKSLQAGFTRKMQQLSRKSEELEEELEQVRKKKVESSDEGSALLRDPNLAIAYAERLKKEQEDLEGLSPEEKRIRQLEMRVAQNEASSVGQRAQDVFDAMASEDETLANMEDEIGERLKSDPDLKSMARRNPARAISIAYQELLQENGLDREEDVKKPAEKKAVSKEEIDKQKKVAMAVPQGDKQVAPEEAKSWDGALDNALKHHGVRFEDIDFSMAQG